MGIHQPGIRVPRYDAKVQIPRQIREPRQHRQRVDGVTAPVLGDDQEVPPSANCLDALDHRRRDPRAARQRLPKPGIRRHATKELSEWLGRAILCS
jgi:hypothetical protein